MKRLIGWLQTLLPYVIPLALVLIVVVLVLPNTSPLQNGIVENTFQNIVVPIDLPTLTPLPPPTAQSSNCSGFRSEMVLSAVTDNDSDIFLISSEDGKLCNLTLNPANDQFAGWSPDRQYIAFLSNRDSHSDDLFDVYIMKADGSHTQRVSPESEKLVNYFWSPNGQRLYLATNSLAPKPAYMMYVADIQNEDLTISKIYEAQYPIHVSISYTPWSADSEWVTFVQRDESNYSIQLLNATSYRIYSVPVDVSDGALLQWSPDGRFLSYVSSQEQNLCVLTFTQLQEVTPAIPKCFELPDADLYQDFAWSPDSRSVLFTTYNNNDGSEEHHLGLLGVSDDEFIPLNLNLTSDLQYSTGGRWSPNGQYFAFTSDFSIESTSKLFVANSAGAERRELLSVESPYAIYGIEWSSDSKSIVANVAQFLSYDPIQVEYQLHLLNIQNGVKKVLLTAPQISSFDWQP